MLNGRRLKGWVPPRPLGKSAEAAIHHLFAHLFAGVSTCALRFPSQRHDSPEQTTAAIHEEAQESA